MFFLFFKCFFVLFRPPVRSNGRTYKMLVMFLGRTERQFRTMFYP